LPAARSLRGPDRGRACALRSRAAARRRQRGALRPPARRHERRVRLPGCGTDHLWPVRRRQRQPQERARAGAAGAAGGVLRPPQRTSLPPPRAAAAVDDAGGGDAMTEAGAPVAERAGSPSTAGWGGLGVDLDQLAMVLLGAAAVGLVAVGL